MQNKSTIDRSGQARKLFFEDIEATNEYLQEMQFFVQQLCTSEKLAYPVRGRGKTGMFPNFTYALHFRLRGYSTQQAAENYVQRERGKALQPLPQSAAGCSA